MQYLLLAADPMPNLLSQLKEWMNVTHTYHDQLIGDLYETAFEYVEDYTGLAFRLQAWQLSMSPAEAAVGVMIAKNPLVTLDSVETMVNSTYQEITSDQYHLSVCSSSAFFFVTDQTQLTITDEGYNTVKVDFSVNSQSIPKEVVTAIKQIVSFWYENRGDTSAENNNPIPPEATLLLNQKRVAYL